MAQITSTQVPGDPAGGGKRRLFWIGVAVAAVVAGAIFALALYAAQKAETSFEAASRAEMTEVTNGRLSEFNKWLESVQVEIARFANSKIIVDFARDVDEASGNIGEMLHSGGASSAAGQSNITLLQSYLDSFVSFSKFDFGSMLNSRGEMYVNTDPAYQGLTPRQREIVARVVESGKPVLGPIRVISGRPMQMDFYAPILSGNSADGRRVVAVLYLSMNVTPKLRELFNLDGYANQGYSFVLLQLDGDHLQQIDYARDRLRDVTAPGLTAGGVLPFGERTAIGGSKKVYSEGAKVANMEVWVVLEQDYAQARATLDLKIGDYYKLAALVALTLVFLVGMIWLWFISLDRSQTLARFQQLFSVITEQKLLLDSINSAIAEPISLTDASGKYLYVNHAFAEAFGREANNIVGLDTAAVCGFDTARRMNSSDQHVLMTGEQVTTNEIIWLQSKRHYFQISKAPMRDSESQTITGIVSVFRDITKLVEAEEHSHRMVQQTIDALVSTIEQADPFLGGHSRVMGEVARLLGKGLNLSDRDAATIETAATLSQIGKMFVPREVLTKPGALTPEEKKVMEQHVQHTLDALGKIEFELPVLEAIAQMNERLDGKGYPAGLKGDEISIYGKVLAVANAFTAMARPRSYRPAMDVKTVLDTLEKQAGTSYDPHVLEVLRGVLETPAGEQVAAKAAKSTPV